jgi:hypothetical protein
MDWIHLAEDRDQFVSCLVWRRHDVTQAAAWLEANPHNFSNVRCAVRNAYVTPCSVLVWLLL